MYQNTLDLADETHFEEQKPTQQKNDYGSFTKIIVGTGLGLLLLGLMNFSETDNTASCMSQKKFFFVKTFAHLCWIWFLILCLFL